MPRENKCKDKLYEESVIIYSETIKGIKRGKYAESVSEGEVYMSIDDCIQYINDVDDGVNDMNVKLYNKCTRIAELCIEGEKENIMYVGDYE